MNHGVFKEKNGNSAFCTKIWSRGGQDAQNETCARLSKSNQNENLNKLARVRLACSRLACFKCACIRLACVKLVRKFVCKLVCLVGFLVFFGLFLNSQNNLFAGEPHAVTKNGSYYYDEQGLKYSISNSVATVAGVNNIPASGKITIPNEISYTGNNITPTIYPVTTIAANAFRTSTAQANLKEVDASDCTNLDTIGQYAFYQCAALQTADFSGCTNLDTIGQYAFYQCAALTTANFSGCIKLNTIGIQAFYQCKALTTADFSDCTNLDKIDQFAFRDCEALTIANFSGFINLKTIGIQAFSSCTGLTTADFSGCANLQTIGDLAFYNCSKAEVILESGAFSAADSSIGIDAFVSGTRFVKRVTVLGGDNERISDAVSHKKVTFNQLSVGSSRDLTTKTVMVQYVKSSKTGNYVKDPSQPAYTYTNAAGEEATRNYQYIDDNRTVKNYGSFWRLPGLTTAFAFGGDAGTSGTGFTTDITLIDQRAVVFYANGGTFDSASVNSGDAYYSYFLDTENSTYITFAYQYEDSYRWFQFPGSTNVSRADYNFVGYALGAMATKALGDDAMIKNAKEQFDRGVPAVSFYTVWKSIPYTVIQIVNGEEKENDVLLPDDLVAVGDSEDVPGLLYWQVVDASGNSVNGAPTIAGDTTIKYSDLATNGGYHNYIVDITEDDGEQPILIRCLKLVAAVRQHKIVEFKLQKTFASGGSQFFAAIGTAAGKQSPSQSIPEFLKSNVAEKMFDVKRAASSSVKEGEETSLTNKTTALAAKEDDWGYYVITDVAYTDGSNSFTVTFNVVVPVGDTSGEIRLRESANFAPGLFTVKYDNSTENYCALPYANLKDPSV